MGLTASPEQPHLETVQRAASTDKGVAEISLLDLLILLARRRKFILLSTASCTVVAALVVLLIPISFTATTSFLPPQQASSGSSALLAQLGNLGSLAGLAGGGGVLKNPNDLYVALMKSETVEDAMLRRFDLIHEYHAKGAAVARKAFEQHVTIDGSGKDGLIHVSVQDHDAKRAAELANGYIDEYRQLSASLAISEASQRRAFFEQQLKDAKEQLVHSEEALKLTQQTTGVIQMDSQSRALIESAGNLRAEIVAKEVQVQSMRTYAGAGNADLIEAEQQLSSLREQLAKLTGSGNDSSSGLLVSKGAIPQAGLEYIRKMREVKYDETIFEILARQFEAAKLDEAKEGALIQVVDPAHPPERKSWPPRTLIVLAAMVLSFLGACFWVLAKEALAYLRNMPQYAEKIKSI